MSDIFQHQCKQQVTRRDSSGKKNTTRYRITVLGSPGVGKSALTVRYITKRFLHEYDPAAKVYTKEIVVHGHKTELQIFDVSTQHDLEDASDPSEMSCAWSDGFVLVYSITDAASLTTAIELKREIDQKRKFRSTHFILVGNKSDLVQHRRVSEKDGRSAAESLGCCFTEASARDNVAVEDAFEKAVKTMGPTSRRNSIIGVMTPSSETRKKKIPFLSKAKAKLGHTSPIALAMGLGGKRMSQPETQPLTIKTIASMRRASVA